MWVIDLMSSGGCLKPVAGDVQTAGNTKKYALRTVHPVCRGKQHYHPFSYGGVAALGFVTLQ